MALLFFRRNAVMIKIIMTNSQTVIWNENEFDDYMYDGKFFIVLKNKKWIGFYNLDHIISVIVK